MKLFLLYLSAALVATVNSLTCVCTDCATGTCTIPSSEAVCLTVVQENNLGGADASGVIRRCQFRDQFCGESISVTTAGGLFTRTISKCCNSDNCSNTPLELPPRSLNKNGVNCPGSFTLDAKDKKEPGTLSCTGDEIYCISVSGQLTTGNAPPVPFAASGCASEGACRLPVNTYLVTGVMDFRLQKIDCNPAPATSG